MKDQTKLKSSQYQAPGLRTAEFWTERGFAASGAPVPTGLGGSTTQSYASGDTGAWW